MGEPAAVYAETLARYKYGHPLWWPEPTRKLLGKPWEVEIGDVGYVDGDGEFRSLFNVTCDPSHARNAGGTPTSFAPLAFDTNCVNVKERFCTRGPLHSTSVKSHKIETRLDTYIAFFNRDDLQNF